MRRLFVYGTLRRGERAHHLLQNARFLGARSLPGFEARDLGAYPGIVPRAGHAVGGELWEVEEEALGPIDAWEDHPRLFVRTPVVLDDGSAAEAYVFNLRTAREAR